MQLIVLQSIALIMTGLMVGNELAVSAFVHPQLNQLEDKCHAASTKALARIYGSIMPFWYVTTLILTIGIAFILQHHRSALFFTTIAAIIWSLLILFTIVKLVPINNKIGQMSLEKLPDGWKDLRKRWDRLHAIRVGFLVIALICLTVACQISTSC
ncbi:MAG: DUF1772 domain-containing protein [Richelia sp. RM2_1_2]|uniref:DUF1772 domain-containing protein n=1 Tax=Plectonema cf. radiosum LEGE 06105 TaxID=945769 RepID=A0A8J7JYJ6_9CYAN|nr:DUF1772 domain-containing protein [Plectonema radiosum]NJL80703.1 DUF1772 domain-containing protein [Richelia sp. SM2_1_7]NJM18982.1 DUF1772 domain-containing protein [Richelia sp. SM1_7_0]NJO30928.1 DUF1772 domain-containing protein [Richelia sp. SL_2_1]NJO58528.1 DUF1772 domain-containing protein [Richelia sp. RM2_1_2]MBE9211381.1 DUF1772 domain-containing protein [Plectonema cf. radiosum LEGE 06105]